MFIDLLPELRRRILADCCVDDVLNLALTCSTYNMVLQEHLFQTIEIPLDNMLNYELPSEQTILGLRYVNVLRVVSGRPWTRTCHGEANEEESSWKEENVTAYLEEILEHCSLKAVQFQCYSSYPVNAELEITHNMMDLLSKKCPDLRSLKLDCCDMSDNILARLGSLSLLTDLSLRFCLVMTNLGLKSISESTSLKKLDLAMNFQLSDEGVMFLTSLTNLEELDISGCHQLTDNSVKCICRSMSRLRTLCAASVWNVTDAGIFHLTNLPDLRRLNLSGLEVTGNASLPYLTQLGSTLKELDIRRWTKVAATEMMPYLSTLCGLEVLLLGQNNFNSSRIDLRDLSFLFPLLQLRKLDLNFCNITVDAFSHLRVLPLRELAVCIGSDEALSHISQISSLLKLFIRKSNTTWGFSDIGLSHLKNIPNLQVLRLRNYKLTQMMMSRIGNLVTLKKLSVSGDSSVDDLGLLNISGLVTLHELDISGNRFVTDRGLQYVSALKRLRRLNIGSCPQISDVGVSHLSGLPQLRILAITLRGRRYTDECFSNIGNVKLVHSDYFYNDYF